MRGRCIVGLVASAACGRVSFDATSARDTGVDVPDTAPACVVATEPSRVSAYTFADASVLGRDVLGANDMSFVVGNPQQSTDVPPGRAGFSLAVDGASGVCLAAGWTFDSTADHTACWWAKPATLADSTNVFAHTCGYDTWTANGGSTYRWRINNCNGGTTSDLDVPNVYAVDTWVQICQTYERASLTRTVYINGEVANPHAMTDAQPILMPAGYYWCIGSYYFDSSGGGGYWNGVIYAPIWFARVLSPADIKAIHDQPCSP